MCHDEAFGDIKFDNIASKVTLTEQLQKKPNDLHATTKVWQMVQRATTTNIKVKKFPICFRWSAE